MALVPVALAQPSAPAGRNAVELLNERLKSMTLNVLLPHSEVAYSQRHYTGDDIAALGRRVEQAWASRIAPPLDIVPEIFGILTKPRTETQPDSVVYLYKKTGIFGLCMGWYVAEHPLGGGPPETGYTITTCRSGSYKAVTPGSFVFPTAPPPAEPGDNPAAAADQPRR